MTIGPRNELEAWLMLIVFSPAVWLLVIALACAAVYWGLA